MKKLLLVLAIATLGVAGCGPNEQDALKKDIEKTKKEISVKETSSDTTGLDALKNKLIEQNSKLEKTEMHPGC